MLTGAPGSHDDKSEWERNDPQDPEVWVDVHVLLSIVEELRAEDGSDGREGNEYQPDDGYQPHTPAVVEVDLAVVGGVDVECLS